MIKIYVNLGIRVGFPERQFTSRVISSPSDYPKEI